MVVYTLVNASLSGSAIDLQKMMILAEKNHLVRWSSFWSWRVCKQAKLSHAYIEKPKHPKPVTVWCGFWSGGIIWSFFFWAVKGGPFWTNFWSQKLRRKILETFGFNRTAVRATQPKLHSIFCALFLNIALSAAELMSFGHLGTVIWHRWTINGLVGSRHIRRKARVRVPGQTSKRNTKNISSAISSQQISGKNSESK